MAASTSNAAEVSLFGGSLAGKTIGGTANIGTTSKGGINITVNASTGADPNALAQEIAWKLKTAAY